MYCFVFSQMQNPVELVGDFNDNISIHFARIRNCAKEFINVTLGRQMVMIGIQLCFASKDISI